jgi:ribosomal protein L40E
MVIKCNSCENIISPDAKFCTKCGNTAPNSNMYASLCDCGANIPEGAKFCTKCGKSTLIMTHNQENTIKNADDQEIKHVLKTVGETLSAEETKVWLKKYLTGQKKGTWIFYGIVLIIVLVIVIIGAENTKEALYAFSFFFIIFTLLAVFTRKRTNKTWIGTIKDKRIIKGKKYNSQDDIGRTVLEPTLYFKLKSGSAKLSVTNEMFQYFNVGDKIFKLSGTDYPELQELTPKGRVCIVCGAIMPMGHPLKCKKCKCPVPDYLSVLKEVGLD